MAATQRIYSAEKQEGSLPCDPEQSRMISIPLKPREIYVPRRVVWRRWVQTVRTAARERISTLPKVALPQWDKRRTRDGLRSIAIGLAVNALCFALLCFIAVGPDLGRDEGILFAVSTEASTDPATESASSEEESEEKDQPAIPAQAAPSAPAMNLLASTALSPVTFETTVDNPALGAGLDLEAPKMNFGSSMSTDQFEAAESAWMKPQRGRSNSKSNSGGLSRGVSTGDLAGVFSGEGESDGSKIVLFLDQSGSMQQISSQVKTYVKRKFKRARTVGVSGCSMRTPNCEIVTNLREYAFQTERTEYYFVCDLYDGIKAEAVESMRDSIMHTTSPRRLHIISFGVWPTRQLKDLIAECNGSLHVIEPIKD